MTLSMLVYLAVNAYVGWRVCVLWARPRWLRWLVALTILLLTAACAHSARDFARESGWPIIARAAELWMGPSVFLASWFLAGECVWWIARRWAHGASRARGRIFLTAVLLAGVTSLWAYHNAQVLRVTHYRLAVAKDAGRLRHLRAVLLADLHLGKGPPPLKLERAVALVNAQDPDIILVAGDIAEFGAENFERYDYASVFRALRAPLGIYAVRGNHDFYAADHTLVRRMLRRAGIVSAEETAFLVDDSFYVAGRLDRAQPRAPLSQVLHAVDRGKPVLLLDHRPDRIEESEEAGVDVQFSGHTHGGQFFPANAFTRFIYPANAGVFRQGPFALVVTSGVWGGAPYRLGTRTEIVVVDIDFLPPEA